MESNAGTLRRRQLGRALRGFRQQAGLTGEQVGAHLERSTSWVSRVESGRIALRVRDVHDILDLYGVTDAEVRSSLEELAREGKQRGWWSQYADALAETYAQYIGLEDVAKRLEMYEDSVLPGLLQTEAYIRGLFAVSFPRIPAGVAESRLAARLERQKILARDPPPFLDIVVEESVLYRAYGGRNALQEQLTHLRAQMDNRSIRVRVVPLANPTAMVHSFTILGFSDNPEVVYTEADQGGFLHGGKAVQEHREVFEYIKTVALDDKASERLIERAIDQNGATP
jgi:transcriptional regulator with XRE-family HTH domain